MTYSDGDDRNKLIDMITQTVTSVCDVAAISVGGRPRTARGPLVMTTRERKIIENKNLGLKMKIDQICTGLHSVRDK